METVLGLVFILLIFVGLIYVNSKDSNNTKIGNVSDPKIKNNFFKYASLFFLIIATIILVRLFLNYIFYLTDQYNFNNINYEILIFRLNIYFLLNLILSSILYIIYKLNNK